jgi:hypothetical protein
VAMKLGARSDALARRRLLRQALMKGGIEFATALAAQPRRNWGHWQSTMADVPWWSLCSTAVRALATRGSALP